MNPRILTGVKTFEFTSEGEFAYVEVFREVAQFLQDYEDDCLSVLSVNLDLRDPETEDYRVVLTLAVEGV